MSQSPIHKAVFQFVQDHPSSTWNTKPYTFNDLEKYIQKRNLMINLKTLKTIYFSYPKTMRLLETRKVYKFLVCYNFFT